MNLSYLGHEHNHQRYGCTEYNDARREGELSRGISSDHEAYAQSDNRHNCDVVHTHSYKLTVVQGSNLNLEIEKSRIQKYKENGTDSA